MTYYNFVKEFTKYPGPRFIRLGKHSGEEFREDILRAIFVDDKSIDIDATGVLSFGPSFLDEAFSPLASEYGIEIFREKIKFHSDDDAMLYIKMIRLLIF